MTEEEVFARMGEIGAVPVVALDDAGAALPLADALLAGGIGAVEITFRTDAAADAIRTISSERPDMLVGAGTVLTAENARRAADCGAQFAVAPGFSAHVVRAAQEAGLAFAPGVVTPTDVQAALALGLRVLKFFPAEAAGGARLLKSLAAPYAHTAVRFIPTGGVNAANMTEYLKMDCVLAVGGSWLARRAAIAERDWESITRAAREARETVAMLRAAS
ncbi:MAG: bifunctional 4-hydroxy-2-oxoglutarate aldolase/2-dehydro-3-deoxy-phosphogluconate aldolase [Candidatus Brocadiia bacterium]